VGKYEYVDAGTIEKLLENRFFSTRVHPSNAEIEEICATENARVQKYANKAGVVPKPTEKPAMPSVTGAVPTDKAGAAKLPRLEDLEAWGELGRDTLKPYGA